MIQCCIVWTGKDDELRTLFQEGGKLFIHEMFVNRERVSTSHDVVIIIGRHGLPVITV